MKHVINKNVTLMLKKGTEAQNGYTVIHKNDLLMRHNGELWTAIDRFQDDYIIYACMTMEVPNVH